MTIRQLKALSNIVDRIFNDVLSAQAPVNEKVTVDNLKQSIKNIKICSR